MRGFSFVVMMAALCRGDGKLGPEAFETIMREQVG